MVAVPVVQLAHGADLALPARQTPGSAGYDLLAAIEGEWVFAPGERRLVPTGIAAAIPEGFEGQVRPRSGLAVKHGVTVLNAPGTIDSDYRGEIRVPLINLGQEPFVLRRGDRIAQLLLTAVEILCWDLVDDLPAELPEGARGDRGFGSTGR